MNKVLLIGRLTADPDVYYPAQENGTTVAKFTLAVDRKKKTDNGPTADFIRCSTFGKTAETMDKHLRKGSKISAEGRIATGSYVKNNNRIYTTDIVVEAFEFLDSKKESDQREDAREAARAAATERQADADGFMNIPDGIEEELPFK